MQSESTQLERHRNRKSRWSRRTPNVPILFRPGSKPKEPRGGQVSRDSLRGDVLVVPEYTIMHAFDWLELVSRPVTLVLTF